MDLFKDVLPEIDRGNLDFIKNLNEKELKELAPFIIMKFMSGSKKNSEYHLIAINEIVNKNFWKFSDYKDLQLMLLTICGIGSRQYHYFPGKSITESKLYKFIKGCFPLLKHDEIELYLSLNGKEHILELAKNKGLQDKEIKELFK
jgi:hypothetical protein